MDGRENCKRAQSIVEISGVVSSNGKTLKCMRAKELLRTECECDICQKPMSLAKTKVGDEDQYICRNCLSKKSIRFFEVSQCIGNMFIHTEYKPISGRHK